MSNYVFCVHLFPTHHIAFIYLTNLTAKGYCTFVLQYPF